MTGDLIQFPDDRAEINRRIYHYKRAGDSFEEIAAKLEITSAEAVRGFRAYMTDLISEVPITEREHTTALELERLDQLMKPFYAAGVEGEKEGAEVYLKISAQRHKLLKLDQPSPDDLHGRQQIIVVTGNKEEFEKALREGQMKQVAGPAGDDDDEEEAK